MDFDKQKYLKTPRSVPGKILSERGELLCYFRDTVNASRRADDREPLPIGFYVKKLQGIFTKDLYALKSKMLDGERRGVPAGAIFFLELKAPSDVVSPASSPTQSTGGPSARHKEERAEMRPSLASDGPQGISS